MTAPATTSARGERPGEIHAIPVRHPGRWVAVTIIAILLAMFLHLVFTNKAFNWPFVFRSMGQPAVLQGLLVGTLGVALTSMLFAIIVGIMVAIMRLSENPVLKGVAFAWAWAFRGVPRYVLLSIMGALGALFLPPTMLQLGVPFDWLIIKLFGGHGTWRFATIDANALFGGFFGAVFGMVLSESAYMSEIARAGILSVDRGQAEAAQALGMNSRQTMTRIVLPQAMRIIVPPTGSEFISMVKDTSLLVALPLTNEMFYQMKAIGSRTYQILPVLVGAALYYLAFTTILMIIQSRLEKYFGRGYGTMVRSRKVDPEQQVPMAVGGADER